MPTKIQTLIAKKNRENAHDPHYYKWGPNRIHNATNIDLPRVKQILVGLVKPTFAEGRAILNLVCGPRSGIKVREVWPVLSDDATTGAARKTKLSDIIADDRKHTTVRNRQQYLTPSISHR